MGFFGVPRLRYASLRMTAHLVGIGGRLPTAGPDGAGLGWGTRGFFCVLNEASETVGGVGHPMGVVSYWRVF